MKVNYQVGLKYFPGLLVFAISFAVYGFTVSPTVSFWDCGELISSATFLQVPHPPGAPLYLLVARVFSLMASNPGEVAFYVNGLSVVASAATVLLIYNTLKLILPLVVAGRGKQNRFILEVASAMGALLFAFTDTFWFSAVEAEVYALSLFFTALTLWVFLKWYTLPRSSKPERWLFLGIYLVGLSMGVHLLNLLLVPAFVLLFGWNRWGHHLKVTLWSIAAGFGILVLLYVGLVSNGLFVAKYLERFMVNDLGFFQHSGVLLWWGSLTVFLVGGIWYSYRRYARLHFLLVAAALIIMGWSSYSLIPVRAAAGTPINMNGPDNVFSLENYINRKQYGERPLLYGVHAWAQPSRYKVRFDWDYDPLLGKYSQQPAGLKVTFPEEDYRWFPRVYSRNAQQSAGYEWWVGRHLGREDPPGWVDGMNFFLRYQMGQMYLRYLFWNFVGRQNGEPGHGDVFSGNWASGINAVDSHFLGDRQWPGATELYSAARNHYFGLPLLLAILGFLLLLRQGRHRWPILIWLSLLFFLTGPVIVCCLNQPPLEPRERDYIFVGSFMVVTLFAGIGIHGILRSVRGSSFTLGLVVLLVALAGPGLLFSKNLNDHDRSSRYLALDLAASQLRCCPPDAILFTYGDNDTYPLWYAQQVTQIRRDVRLVNLGLLNTSWSVHQQRSAVPGSRGLEFSLTDAFYRSRGNVLCEILSGEGTNADGVEMLKELEAISATGTHRRGMIAGVLPASLWLGLIDEDSLQYRITSDFISKGDLALIDIVATNGTSRPICFTRNTELKSLSGLEAALIERGLVWQLAREDNRGHQSSALRRQLNLFVDSISIGRGKGPWWDNTCREALEASGYRELSISLAQDLLQQNDSAEAAAVLKKSMNEWPFSPFVSAEQALTVCSLLGRVNERELAEPLLDEIFQMSRQNLFHNYSLGITHSEIQKRFCPIFVKIKALADSFMMPKLSDTIDQEMNSLCEF